MKTTTFLKKSGKFFLGKIALVLSGLFSSIFFARGLGAMGYGALTLALSILGVFGRIFSFGFNKSNNHFLAKYYKENKDKGIKILKFLFKWRVIIGVILTLTLSLSSGLIANIYGQPRLATVLKVLAIGFFFNFLQGMALTAFRGIKKMIFLSYKNIFWSFVKILPIALAILGFGLIAVSWSYTILFVSTFFLCFSLLNKELNLFEKTFSVFKKKKVLKYGFLSYGTSLLGLGLFKATLLITGFFSVANVGFLRIGKKIGKITVFLAGPLSAVLFPTISDLWERKKERAKVLFKRITRYRIFLSVPFVVLIFLFGKSGIRYIYGKKFLPAFSVLAIISLAYLTRGLLGTFGQLIMGTENVEINLRSGGVMVALNLPLAFLLIPKFGIKGAAAGYTIAIVVGTVWASYKAKRKIKVSYPKKAVPKALLASLLAAAASYPIFLFLHIGLLEFIPILLTFTGVYFLALFLLKGFRDFEIKFIKKFIREKRYLDYLGLR